MTRPASLLRFPPLEARGTDEFHMPRPGARERRARARLLDRIAARAARTGSSLPGYARSRCGTVLCLRALDEAAGGGFYPLPPEAEEDEGAVAELLSGGPVVDVQTHYVATRQNHTRGMRGVLDFIRSVAPDRFADLDPATSLGFAEYLRCVFAESETAVAVLTAAPGLPRDNILPNPDIAATREILDRLAGTGRLLHHAIVHPEQPGEREALPELLEGARPDGLKVYTLHGSAARPRGWALDDEEVGAPFLEAARDAGARLVCAHKGLSGLAPAGSPADVGPAAAAFPELTFVVYHAGYEVPARESEEEREFLGPRGTDRLVGSLREVGIGPGGNVYAELGSTWACLARRPLEAAHVLGKLLRALGPERILWGTDSVWYGPAQPLIDSFRAFQIPERLRERFGYPALDARSRDLILGGNAARLYGIDLPRARERARADDLAWMREAVAEARRRSLFDAPEASD